MNRTVTRRTTERGGSWGGLPRSRTLRVVGALLLAVITASAQPATNRVPPVGLELPAEERRVLLEEADALGREIAQLKGELAPDVQIFHKAVEWAVVYREFYRTNEIGVAKRLLQQGRERAKELRAGKASWATSRGLVVRGFVSRIDDSVQPYGLVVPAIEPKNRRYRLDVWLHGRDNQLTELKFINDRQRTVGEVGEPGMFVLHPYGRYCNAFKFAGERDVFEAIAHVCKHYPIDPNRITIRGFSMGGAGVWHLAAHYPGFWAAAAPGAGFAETAEYTQILKRNPVVPWYERVLWRWYDGTDYAANFANCPVIAYSGELDKQRQAAEIMGKAMEREGLRLRHLIGPKTAHKYEPTTKAELDREISKIVASGKPAVPNRVHLTTYTLRYNSNNWITVDALEKHWERADVEAEVLQDLGMIRIKTRNVSRLTISFPTPPTLDLAIDQNLWTSDKMFKGGTTVRLKKFWERWSVAGEATGLRKRHGLQGPIDDAFMDRFVMVAPSANASAWVRREFARATNEWRAQFRGEARVKNEAALTPEDIATSHLVVWGDPRSSHLLARALRDLPLRWGEKEFRLAGKSFASSRYAPVLVYPNPLNRERYIVINSGFTFPEAGAGSNALQTPKLPDFAVIDTTLSGPGRVVHAGFFDEEWRWKAGLW